MRTPPAPSSDRISSSKKKRLPGCLRRVGRSRIVGSALAVFLLVPSAGVTAAVKIARAKAGGAAPAIHLGAYHGDPSRGAAPKADALSPHRLRLVQLTGRVHGDWREDLEAAGYEVLAYVPRNAYLVWSPGSGARVVKSLDRFPFVRWHGPIPRVAKRSQITATVSGGNRWMVLHVVDIAATELPMLVTSLGGAVEGADPAQPDGRLWLSHVRLAADRLPELTDADGVVWVQPAPRGPAVEGEMSSLVVSGSFDPASPAPGYRDWIDDLGWDGQGVVWAVVDSGVDPLHPDFSHLEGLSYPGCETALPGDDPGESGHGTPVASVVAGTGETGLADADGFLWGLGIAPGASLFSQNAICSGSVQWPPDGGWQILSRDGLAAGAVGSNNSWNSQEGDAHGYQITERIHDLMVRDGDFDTPEIAEPYILVFNAGNHGPDPSVIPAPKEAKNLITVGAIDNWRTAGNLNSVVEFSSRGPTLDGRLFPTVTAPGRGVGAARHRLGGIFGLLYEIFGTDGLYMSFEGTSAAAPHVSGMLAVVTQWWRHTRHRRAPSPAAARAMLVNAALPIGDGQPVPNSDVGWGLANLERMVAPDEPVWILDQTEVLVDAGGVWMQEVVVADPSNPLRVTLAWTDEAAAPGADPALVNDLDLTVTTDGATFVGNHLQDGVSTTGGHADRLNNLEAVIVSQPGTSAVVAVTAANLPGDGVPFNRDLTDQDFALVCRNCVAPTLPPRRPSGRVGP